MSYKIAVASSDGSQVDETFGSVKGFLIYEVEGETYEKEGERIFHSGARITKAFLVRGAPLRKIFQGKTAKNMTAGIARKAARDMAVEAARAVAACLKRWSLSLTAGVSSVKRLVFRWESSWNGRRFLILM